MRTLALGSACAALLTVPLVGQQGAWLRLAWRKKLGSGYAGVAATADLAVTTFSDGKDDHVAAFALGDGAERWRRRIGPTFRGRHGAEDGPLAAPLVHGGRVFVAGPRGHLAAFTLATGKELWSVDLARKLGVRIPPYGFGPTLVAWDDRLYVPARTLDRRSGLAFDASTGELVWAYRGNRVDYQSASRVGDELLVADMNDVAWLDPATGNVNARFVHSPRTRDLAYPQVTRLGPARFLFTFERNSVLYEATRTDPALAVVWKTRELKDCYVRPVAHGTELYGMSGTFFACVDAATGKRVWKSRAPGARGVILAHGHLFLLASTGELVAVRPDRTRYREIARLPVAQRGTYTPLTHAAGRILGRNTAEIFCVEIGAGAVAALPEQPVQPKVEGEFGRFLKSLAGARDKGAALDAWWKRNTKLPVVEGETVHFVYRGAAQDVALLGDMTRDLHVPLSMYRVPGTDLFHRSVRGVRAALWQYSFLVDFERAVPDPRNPWRAPAVAQIAGNPPMVGFRPAAVESVASLPGWRAPEFLTARAKGTGRIEKIAIRSRRLRGGRPLSVYLPAGYDDGSHSFSVLWVLGTGWLEDGGMQTALDNLMGRVCAPAVVVFVPYDTGSRDRIGTDDLVRVVLRDVVPVVAKRYRTLETGAFLGAADNAATALLATFLDPKRFPRAGVQSPFLDAEDFALLAAAKGRPAAVYMDWSRYQPVIRDENVDHGRGAERLRKLLRARGCEVTGGEVTAGSGWPSWSSRWDRVLAALLPLR